MSYTEQEPDSRATLTTAIEAVAAVLILGGTAWLSVPAAVIVAGLMLLAVSWLIVR